MAFLLSACPDHGAVANAVAGAFADPDTRSAGIPEERSEAAKQRIVRAADPALDDGSRFLIKDGKVHHAAGAWCVSNSRHGIRAIEVAPAREDRHVVLVQQGEEDDAPWRCVPGADMAAGMVDAKRGMRFLREAGTRAIRRSPEDLRPANALLLAVAAAQRLHATRQPGFADDSSWNDAIVWAAACGARARLLSMARSLLTAIKEEYVKPPLSNARHQEGKDAMVLAVGWLAEGFEEIAATFKAHRKAMEAELEDALDKEHALPQTVESRPRRLPASFRPAPPDDRPTEPAF